MASGYRGLRVGLPPNTCHESETVAQDDLSEGLVPAGSVECIFHPTDLTKPGGRLEDLQKPNPWVHPSP